MAHSTHGRWRRAGPPAAAAGLTILVALLVWLLSTAVPVVIDVRPGLAAAGALAAASHVVLYRRAAGVAARIALGGLATLTLGAALLATWDLTLAYRTEEITVSGGDVVLAGTLYLPRGHGPHPAVVLVHGSGEEARDEYRFYARAYARRGIAALAYDKRGSGRSTGTVHEATYHVLAADVAAAVDAVRGRPDIDRTRVGLWGLSEGEWVAPLAAARIDPAFLVLVSASAMTPAEQVGHEAGRLVRLAGFDDEAARQATELYALLSEFQRSGSGRDELNARLSAAAREPWFDAARYLDASVPDYASVQALAWFPAWRARMDFSALPILAGLRCPVLALAGGADPKNDGQGALDRLRLALAAGGNTAFTGRLYPRAGHGMVEWRFGDGIPPPFLAHGYVDDQIAWVRRVTSRANPD